MSRYKYYIYSKTNNPDWEFKLKVAEFNTKPQAVKYFNSIFMNDAIGLKTIEPLEFVDNYKFINHNTSTITWIERIKNF